MTVALNYKTCQTIWETNATQVAMDFRTLDHKQKRIIFLTPRTSAVIEGEIVFFSTQPWALALAINKRTGLLVDLLQLNPHPYAVITMSPTTYDGAQYWGVSSREETAARKFPDVSYHALHSG